MATSNGTDTSRMINENGGYTVELYAYDMTPEIKKCSTPENINDSTFWHTGIVAYGREYFFGSSGIESCSPGSTILGEPKRVEELGESEVPYQLFLEYIFGLAETKYKPGTYNILNKNGNTFTEEISQFLCGRGIAKDLLDLPAPLNDSNTAEALDPILKGIQLRKTDSKSITFGDTSASIQSYIPQPVRRERDDIEFDELNSAIEEVRTRSLALRDRRNSLNEKLLKKERKEKKKKKKKKENGEGKKKKDKNKGLKIVTFDDTVEQIGSRRHSEPAVTPHCDTDIIPSFKIVPPTPEINQNGLPETSNPPEMSDNTEVPLPEPSQEEHSEGAVAPEEAAPFEGAAAAPPLDTVAGEPEPEIEREPALVFKDSVDVRGEFEGFVSCCAEMLSPEEQRHMEELRSYVIDDEGSWALGENFNSLFVRVFHDPAIPDEARMYLLRIMSAAALKDDVILMLHQDRKEHTIMNFANKIESLAPSLQEALALFFCNMFEHLSPSEWLLYISEWPEGGQQISNIRVTTKIAVNALLHPDPKVQEYGTAIMYNLGTKEVKTVVFDDVAPELAMAILQFFNGSPSEDYVWRTLTALYRFSQASNEVPTLIKMIGPEPSAFKGMSERIDQVIEDLTARLDRVRF